MFHRWTGPSHKCHLSTVSSLVFRLTAVLLLLTNCGGEMIGSSKPILALIGDDIILPCHLKPGSDVVAMTLEWARLDLNPRFVHVRRDGVELLVRQNPSYVGRTSLSTDRLQRGDISLSLSKVKLSDEGTYKCLIPDMGTSEIDLVVGAVSSPVIIMEEITPYGLVLQCESEGWYPEPEVLWLDSEGNLLSAGSTESVRGPDDLYTVSSRVTVERRHNNMFTCRVTQNIINQTRETHVHVSDKVFMSPRQCGASIAVVVSFGLLLLTVLFVFLWKRYHKKEDDQNHRGNETDIEAEEKEPLWDEEAKLVENVKEKQNEQEDMQHVITALTDRKEELETLRDTQKSELEMMEEKLKENEKEITKKRDKYAWDKNEKMVKLLEVNAELKKIIPNYQNTLKRTEERLQKTTDMITRMTDRKERVEQQTEHMNKQLEEMKKLRDKMESELTEEEEQTDKHTQSSPDTEHHQTQPDVTSSQIVNLRLHSAVR